ncbi:hypothetical protein SAMN04487948_13211 [Halogranum amylolyticum]|uniref:Alpha/beta hydrolase family protein n=1 Tax=Halogranum amylolyticum TaxID=660520 RepID=A0A1H8WK74_9EURY|nr:alpha/beta hydrolase [Halogranum amylolyticum]SEP28051.1 hypothetical protein SAMN04487948_13211 [Halogranum amylolyticum]
MREKYTTRRRALRAVASLGTVGGLAGCTGTGDSEPTPNADGPTGDESDTATSGLETATESDSGTTASGDATAETVTFPSSVGDEVTATQRGDGDCAVIFLHGVGYGREDWRPQATAVEENGHIALAVALNHDDRESNVEATVGAVDYLRSEVDVETVVLVGASAGANAVVKTDANTDVDVAGSFVLAPGRAGDLGAGLSGRKLFVVGEGDSQRFVETTKQLHGDASGPKDLVILDAAEHAQGVFETSAGDRLQSLLVEFVNTVCSMA